MRRKKFIIIIITFSTLFISVTPLIAQNSSELPIPSPDSCFVIPADNIGHSLITSALLKGLYYKRLSIIQDSVISKKDSLISSYRNNVTSSLSAPVIYKTNWAITALCTSAAFIINWTIYLLINLKK
jgi:hypothetical protein